MIDAALRAELFGDLSRERLRLATRSALVKVRALVVGTDDFPLLLAMAPAATWEAAILDDMARADALRERERARGLRRWREKASA